MIIENLQQHKTYLNTIKMSSVAGLPDQPGYIFMHRLIGLYESLKLIILDKNPDLNDYFTAVDILLKLTQLSLHSAIMNMTDGPKCQNIGSACTDFIRQPNFCRVETFPIYILLYMLDKKIIEPNSPIISCLQYSIDKVLSWVLNGIIKPKATAGMTRSAQEGVLFANTLPTSCDREQLIQAYEITLSRLDADFFNIIGAQYLNLKLFFDTISLGSRSRSNSVNAGATIVSDDSGYDDESDNEEFFDALDFSEDNNEFSYVQIDPREWFAFQEKSWQLKQELECGWYPGQSKKQALCLFQSFLNNGPDSFGADHIINKIESFLSIMQTQQCFKSVPKIKKWLIFALAKFKDKAKRSC